jgi:hypothetical protein
MGKKKRERNRLNHSDQPIPDTENPEWTPEKFARVKRFNELPQGLRQTLARCMRGQFVK